MAVLSIDVDIVKTFEELEEEIQKFNKLKQQQQEIMNKFPQQLTVVRWEILKNILQHIMIKIDL